MTAAARARATIDCEALRHNLALLRAQAPRASVIGVVKADAYGHGATRLARVLVGAGCERLAVVSLDELVELRDAGVREPVLLLGGLAGAAEAREASQHGATVVLHGPEDAAFVREAVAGKASPQPVHVEVDTGMSRMGVPCDVAASFIADLAGTPGLLLEGVFTHFARADEPDLKPTLEQSARFRGVLAELARAGIRPDLVHASNSAGVFGGVRVRDALPEENAIRPGLALYGVRPAEHLGAGLRPVMTLRAPVVRVQELRAGDAVGYGASWHAPRATRVATLGIGYADGVPWSSANSGRVWLAGAERVIAGRVSMDYISVEVADATVAPGDEAIVFGRDADGQGIDVERAAEHGASFRYELLVRVGRRVRREFIGDRE